MPQGVEGKVPDVSIFQQAVVVILESFLLKVVSKLVGDDAPNENAVTVQKTVEALTGEYRNRLEEISNTIQHDRQDIV
ncbi:MAG: hypothetical protein U0N97_00765 [Gemmiger sp.]